jgi:predicted short-subunit dehydrogenase-like oxidoreductase (DUF2520 family)
MPLYHAAAVMASNSVLALVDASQQLLEMSGVDACTALAAIAPLLRASIQNALRLGPVPALTGPVARVDISTLLAHRQALTAASESIRNLYKASALQTVEMAKQRGMPREQATQIEESLR